jgi:single-strand DNA-binding protein
MDINTVTLTGRLTRDAEKKQSNSGVSYCNFSIANNQYGGKGKDAKVSFFDCVIFGKLAEAIGDYLTKGTPVTISGSIQQDRWKGDDGKTRSSIKMIVRDILLASAGKQNNNPEPAAEEFQDDIPF